MFWDITLAVILAVLAAAIGGLAGHLASTKSWHKWFFWSASSAMVVLIGVQTVKNELTQTHLQGQLDVIQQNTEQPAKPPVINLPAPIVSLPPAPRAALQFTFWPPPPHGLTRTIDARLVGNIVTVGITAKGTIAQARNGEIWIVICEQCRFATAVDGAPEPSGDFINRRKRFEVLQLGAFLDDTELQIIPPVGASSFPIELKYSCENCDPVDNDHPQKLKVNILRP